MPKVIKHAELKRKPGNPRRQRVSDSVNSLQSNKNNNEMHEPSALYGGVLPVPDLALAQTNGFFAGLHVVPAAEKITMIKKGISKKQLESIKEQSNLDYESLSSILSVSKAKLHNKKGAEKFDQNTSERILLLADVLAYGQSVFRDKDSFNKWLKTSSKVLGDKLL